MAISENFILASASNSKNIVIALEIDGVPGVISTTPLYTRIRYGDPGVFYGGEDLVYGGLRKLATYNGGLVRPLIQLDGSSLTLSQKIEPEQGRGSVSTLSFQLLDKDAYVTALFSPGVIVPEILNRGVTVYLGYTTISYPEDYHQIFRGRISQIQGGEGFGYIQLSDPNTVRRQTIFYQAKTKLNGAIDNAVTTINVNSNGDFHRAITNLLGNYDSGVRTFIQVDDEIIEYGPSFTVPAGTFGTNVWSNVVRGARGTTAIKHDDNADVTALVEIYGLPLEMALKVMLSGYNGPWIENQPVKYVVFTGDPILMNQSNAYVLPAGVDAVREYNAVAGDFFIASGFTNPANNGVFRIVSFGELAGTANRIIYTANSAAVFENPTNGVFALRSKYDVYPTSCGSKLTPLDVDILTHEKIQNVFINIGNELRILIAEAQSAKTFLEAEVYLPSACYSLTREGRLSVGLTKPPLAQLNMQTIDETNVLNAPLLRPTRATNNRKFFNEIDWEFDADNSGTYTSTYKQLDTDSLNLIGLTSILPIKSKGLHTDLNALSVIQKRSAFLLSRYKNAAVQIQVQVNYGTGVLIEAGDVVIFTDNGKLQIQNWATGDRNLGSQLYEVIERSLDLKTGNINVTLIAGLGAEVTDRYATISPSSHVGVGSTPTSVIIEDSYGAIFPGDEKKKWEDYIGLPVVVHSDDWSQSGEATLLGFDPANPYKMLISPALVFSPAQGFVVDIPSYPTSADPYVQQLYKQSFCHLDPTVLVVAGISSTVFSVSAGDISKFAANQTVLVHSQDWTTKSGEVTVGSVDTVTNQVTVKTSLGFTPSANYEVEYIGFADGAGGYRYI